MASRLLSFRAVATALALTAVVSSCSDDSDDSSTPATGVTYTVDNSSVTAATAGAVSFGNDLIVQGVTGSGAANKGIMLSFPKRTGTFTLSATDTVATATYLASCSDTYEATTGSIVVTTYTPSTTAGASAVAGTFTFTGTNGTATKAVTNGTFNLKF